MCHFDELTSKRKASLLRIIHSVSPKMREGETDVHYLQRRAEYDSRFHDAEKELILIGVNPYPGGN